MRVYYWYIKKQMIPRVQDTAVVYFLYHYLKLQFVITFLI